jgi:hypothetical protein
MTGVNFVDTIIVRQSIEKGTSSVEKPVLPAEFMGKKNSKSNEDRLKLAGDLWIMSAKGTSKIKLSKLQKEKTVDLKGHHISTGRGTSRVKL